LRKNGDRRWQQPDLEALLAPARDALSRRVSGSRN